MEDLIDFNEYKTEKISPIINNVAKEEDTYVEATNNDYLLDNYYRNAMLLFCDHGAWTEDLTSTFQHYRFVIDKYEDLTSVEIEEKCASFFSRNFFEYGAVAVVIMEPEIDDPDGPGMLRAREKSFHENVILKYFTTDVPVSLRGKPKIYITQTNCISHRVAIDDYEDILALHIPNSLFKTRDDTRKDFITKLCANIERFGENGDLHEIVKDTIKNEIDIVVKIEAIRQFVGEEYVNFLTPFFASSSEVREKPKLYCTFKKRCILPVDIYFRQQNVS